MQRLNIHQELLKERSKNTDANKLSEVLKKIWTENDLKALKIKDTLSLKNDNSFNSLNFEKMDSNKIFHEQTIEKICVDYRLRFLDTNYFKGEYPDDLNRIVLNIENEHNTILKNFKIIAPSKLFKLRSPDDPLLFAPMGNGYYYLIHKWGTDLHPLRRIKYWGVKNVENLGISIFLLSLLSTILTKNLIYGEANHVGYLFMLFLFYVKGYVGMLFLLGASSGKNFSQYSWLSKYDKIS